MTRFFLPLMVLLCLFSCSDDDVIKVEDIDVPEGFALSAGSSTVFYDSSIAYDNPAPWVSGAYSTRFYTGDRLYRSEEHTSELQSLY